MSHHHRGKAVEAFVEPPDPGTASSLDDLVERLRLLKVWAGDPSFESIKDRVNEEWTAAGRPAAELARKTTVVDCFRPGRRRWNTDLVVAVVQALHPDVGYVAHWRQVLRVVGVETQAAAQVRVHDSLPQEMAGFTGRATELDQLRHLLRRAQESGGAVVISAIEGMAGVGKTQLAIHAGHLFAQEQQFDRVLFVNLRGFHPDPARPPADPAAVLEGFLRLLGVPGHQIPHDLPARAAAYRECLATTRALVILDNAATEDQIRPLLPDGPGCFTVVTSRRSLAGLRPATHLAVDVFTLEEAVAFLSDATPEVRIGSDPHALARIARRCGCLPLALGLVIGRIRGTPGWTLTEHADRLEERHRERRLDTGVELAFDLSYHHLPADRQRLLRLLALHPGQDLDTYAAAALAGSDLPTARALLDHLCGEHLLQQTTAGRYTFHDLIRAYANSRARDEDPPRERRSALTRLFDYYLAAAAGAMDTLYPAEARRRPRIAPTATPVPTLTDPDAARAWLDTERPALVTVAAHTATDGWPTHTTRLSTILFRYLDGGHHADAVAVHGHAHQAAQHTDDATGEAHALTNLGTAYLQLGRYAETADYLRQALTLFRKTGDHVGQARVLNNLSHAAHRQGDYQRAIDHSHQALSLYQLAGDETGEALVLTNIGIIEKQLGRYQPAADHFQQALALCRATGDRTGEARTLTNLGDAELQLGQQQSAADHLQRALALLRQAGNRDSEAWTLHSLGALHTHIDQPIRATEIHQQALVIFREVGAQAGQAWALNGLGEAFEAAGRAADALTHHVAAHAIAAHIGMRDQQARADAGLGHAHQSLGDLALARRHYQRALTVYCDLGMPAADQVRARLVSVGDGPESG